MHEFFIIFSFCLGMFFMGGIFVEDDLGRKAFFAILAIVWFGGAAFFAPEVFGYGDVTPRAESFDTRLDNGTTYQTIASTKSDSSYVLLVKEFGTSDFYAIRVKTVPPSLFTLVRGKPVAIAAQDKPAALLAK